MTRYEDMSREQLIKTLRSLQAKLDRWQKTGDGEAKLLHELRVHQVELEVQNRELQETRNQLEMSRDRYIDLYDFAPVGYLILDDQGIIREVNLTGADMLKNSRGVLTGLPMSGFIVGEDLSTFFDYLKEIFTRQQRVRTELRLQTHDIEPLDVRLEGMAIADEAQNTRTCRVAMLDIAQRKQAERQTQALLQENRRITQRLFEVQEIEDQRLARELHDELGQWLTAIQADAQTVCNLSEQRCQAIYTSAQAITEAVAQIHDVIRRIVYRLRVGLMNEVGLVESIREQVKLWKNRHSEIHTELTLDGDLDNLAETINVAIYRMIQECLTNVARHAQARRLAIELRRVRGRNRKPDKLILTVTDDGKGMDIPSIGKAWGYWGCEKERWPPVVPLL